MVCLPTRALAFVGMLAAGLAASAPAHAEWRRTSDIELGTAYTLEESSISIGLASPLAVGVTESFQASIHPLLLLLGTPSLAFRLRLTPVDDVTVALNFGGAWSFIRREMADGTAAAQAPEDAEVGYPGSLQMSATVTVALGRDWLVSAGAGPAADFLGSDPIRGLVELHAALHWLAASQHLLILQANGYLDLSDDGALLRPGAQLVYVWAATRTLHIELGGGVGDWVWLGSSRKVRVFPIVDLMLHF